MHCWLCRMSFVVAAAIVCVGASISRTHAAPATTVPATTRPTLTEAEQQAGWKLLFDGTSLAGWHCLGDEGVPKGQWEVKDGCIHCLGSTGKGKREDLATDEMYDNFEFSFEWLAPKK